MSPGDENLPWAWARGALRASLRSPDPPGSGRQKTGNNLHPAWPTQQNATERTIRAHGPGRQVGNGEHSCRIGVGHG